MPSSRPRVSWIIREPWHSKLKALAYKNRRPLSWEAEIAVEQYVNSYNEDWEALIKQMEAHEAEGQARYN